MYVISSELSREANNIEAYEESARLSSLYYIIIGSLVKSKKQNAVDNCGGFKMKRAWLAGT